MNKDQQDILAACIVILVPLWVYLLPSVIAMRRRHRDRFAIYALNIFAGWTLAGWGAALLWSLTGNVDPKTVRGWMKR